MQTKKARAPLITLCLSLCVAMYLTLALGAVAVKAARAAQVFTAPEASEADKQIAPNRWQLSEEDGRSFWHIDNRIDAMQGAQAVYARAIAKGGWAPIERDELLMQGAHGKGVTKLVRRLAYEYPDLRGLCDADPASQRGADCFFDARVEQAVKDFQWRHGLKVDGVVGADTTAALNVSARQRYQQLTVNIERLIAFKPKVEHSYVLVNIPEYRLRYIASGQVKLEKDVVVGKPSWKTPSFSDHIEKLVVNPEWRIPLSIATKEIAPKVAEDPDYLQDNNIVIRKRSYVDDELVDPDSIDWASIKPYEFEHFLVKLPHEENPLGKVKYLFPNPHAVYVHDTPYQQWFEEHERAASHGCIRMEDPFSLAKAIAKERDVERLLSDIHRVRMQRESKTFHLENPLPIHLVYWTAWADEEGRMHFRKDIYNRDEQELAQFATRQRDRQGEGV